MERILIVRLSAMGDILNSMPVAAALQDRYPDCTVDWVIEERWQELLCAKGTPLFGPPSPQKPLVNSIFTVNTRRWRKHLFAKSTRTEVGALRRSIREQDYTTVVDVQGAIRSAVIARFSKSDIVIGFAKPREPQARFLYTKQVAAKGTHIIEQNVSLTQLPVPAPGAHRLPHDAAAEAWCEGELQRLGMNGKFAVLSPGAGWGAKEWPAERYGELAAMLKKDGILSLVNIGPSETELAGVVERASGGLAKPLQCSIGQLIATLRRAALFVGGDTGPMHLANLMGVPVVAIFGPTNPQRNGPFYPPFEVVRHESSATDYGHHDREHQGLLNTTSAGVYEAARKLLRP